MGRSSERRFVPHIGPPLAVLVLRKLVGVAGFELRPPLVPNEVPLSERGRPDKAAASVGKIFATY
jgi:hypothetical protein